MSAANKNLRVGDSYQEILSIALPIAAAIMVPQFNFVINNIFLGSLGEQALGVAGLTGIYYLIFAVIGMGFCNGIKVLMSRKAGENNADEIGKLFYQGIFMAIGIALLSLIFTYFVAEPLFKVFLSQSENAIMAVSFLKIRILGLLFLYLFQLGNTLLVSTNNSKFLIIGTLTETLINIVFDYSLIYGKFGMPELGFNGAAYASLIAEAAGLIVIFFVLKFSKIKDSFKLFKERSLDLNLCKVILKQSSPLILQYAVSIISWEYFYILVEHRGSIDLAISNRMRNILGLFGCFTWAFSSTTNTMISNFIGQAKEDRLIRLSWRISKLSALFAFTASILVSLNAKQLLSIYGQGTDFINLAEPVLQVVLIGMCMTSISTIWMNAVVGTGHTKTALWAELAAVVFYSIYNYIVLEILNLSLIWAWASEWLYWVVLFIPCIYFMYWKYQWNAAPQQR